MTQWNHGYQATLDARSADVLFDSGLRFKDLNKNGRIDVYEDWRQPVDERVSDLLSQMTLEEKAGMLMIDQLNAEAHGGLPDQAAQYVEGREDDALHLPEYCDKLTLRRWRWDVFRSADYAIRGRTVYERDAGVLRINSSWHSSTVQVQPQEPSRPSRQRWPGCFSWAFSAWPKEAGLAATRDMELIAEFARTVAREWTRPRSQSNVWLFVGPGYRATLVQGNRDLHRRRRSCE